jgi:hypothetical protein
MKRIEILIDRVDGEAVTMETRRWEVVVKRVALHVVKRNGEICCCFNDGRFGQNHVDIHRLDYRTVAATARYLRRYRTNTEFQRLRARQHGLEMHAKYPSYYDVDGNRFPINDVIPDAPMPQRHWWQRRTTSVPFGAFWGKKRR